MKPQVILLIGLGGGLGAIGRAWLGYVMDHDFPWATLLVNVLGSALLGLMFAIDVEGPKLHSTARDFLMIGFCGGFTTFSTFSLQTMQQFQRGQVNAAALNIALSLVGTLLAVYLGYRLGKVIWS